MKKERIKKNLTKIINRISRIEGQVKGIHRMIENEKDCLNIITQITAVKAALSMLGVEILKNQICSTRKDKIDKKYLEKIFEIN